MSPTIRSLRDRMDKLFGKRTDFNSPEEYLEAFSSFRRRLERETLIMLVALSDNECSLGESMQKMDDLTSYLSTPIEDIQTGIAFVPTFYQVAESESTLTLNRFFIVEKESLIDAGLDIDLLREYGFIQTHQGRIDNWRSSDYECEVLPLFKSHGAIFVEDEESETVLFCSSTIASSNERGYLTMARLLAYS
jgi:hypothetical protein